jgi:subtilase family serine protease
MSKKIYISALVIIFLLASAHAQTNKIHPNLEEKLQNLKTGEDLTVIIELKEQVNLDDVVKSISGVNRRQKARAVVTALKNAADKYQRSLKKYLKKQQASGAAKHVTPFWIFNGCALTANESLIRSLASRSDVMEIRLSSEIPFPSPTPTAADPTGSTSEWNISMIRAPEVWALNPAYNGSGAVIGSFDSGVSLSHEDLYSRYRGNHAISWFDPYGEHATPYDFYGHGTHTTGTAVGGNAGGSYIGVAPGATWIAAKGFNDEGVGDVSAFHQIFEWFLAPGGDPDNAPDVVNCSWAFAESGCAQEFEADIQAWRAAEIFPAFSSGNDGPAPGSVRSPAANPMSFAVGATDPMDEVAYFTGRGPSPCDSSIKPDISAPGDGIVSAYLWGYAIMSGTSMAAPHVTGAVALLRSIDPSLTVDQLESALTLGAKDLAAPGPDNDSGAGRMDLYVSSQIAIMGPDFPVVKSIATEPVATEVGPTSGTITISRTGSTSSSLDVDFTISGTAEAGSDYVPIPESVTIPSGAESASIQITAIDDLLPEFDETVILTIASDPAYIVSGSNTATVTIESDELIADMIISALTTPTKAGAGQSITITETTKNQGEGAADPSTTQIFLSQDTSVDASDILLGSRSVPALTSGESDSSSTTVTIPEGTEAGNWFIIVKADATEVVVETNEANNVYSRYIQIGPDLRVISLTIPTIIIGPGQNISITETTKNQGEGIAAPTQTQFYLSTDSRVEDTDILLGSRSVPILAAGASNTQSTTITIPADAAVGNWYILAMADGESVVTETSETNNIYARYVQIGPDLTVTSLSVPATVNPGQSISITETTKNQGGAQAGISTTQFFLSTNSTVDDSDILLGSRSVPILAAGASNTRSTTVTIPADTTVGNWYILALADGEEVIAETSELNNKYARLVQIGPDLHILSFSAPTTAGPGQSISITDTTKNKGGTAAEASTTMFYLSTNSTIDGTDTLLGSHSVPTLAAGASNTKSTTVTIPEGTTAGKLYIIAMADGEEVVNEISETNNTYARLVTIGTDLRIISLTVPATAGPGQTITITDTTKNQGGAQAGASTTQFYLSTNSTIGESDTLLGSRSVPALAAGASSYGSTSITIPEGTSSGSYYLIAKADGEDAIIETSETNNTLYKLITIGTDLRITSFTGPSTVGPGQSITVTETTKNQGGAQAEASTTHFYLSTNSSIGESDTLLGSRSVPALAAGASNTRSTTLTIPAGTVSGNWYLVAKADGEDAIIETSETNNTYALLIKVGTDLRISAFSVPTTVGAGQNITITDTTKNQGGGPADPSTTHFYLSTNSIIDGSDTLIGSRSVPALAAGASSSGSTSVTIPLGTASGNWYLIAQADGEDAVIETSETNNTLSRMIKIGTDLRILAFSVPSTVGAGQSITVTDTTKNQGGGPADPSTTQFYLSTNSTVDGSDTYIGSRSVPALAAGASNTSSTTVTIPAGTATGTRYLLAVADGEDVVIETSETNNTYARFIKIGPDLRITSFLVPSSSSPGQSITVTDTTMNQGGGSVDPSTTQFYLSKNSIVDASDTLLGSRNIPALAAGASSSGSTVLTIPADTEAGNWYIVGMADGEEVIVEVYETNNRYSRFISIN